MTSSASTRALRYVTVAGRPINSYQLFLCIGLYCGILLSAVSAARAGASPLRVGAGSLACALVALVGARVYHVAVHLRAYRARGLRRELWNGEQGGWSLFGALAIVPFSFMLGPLVGTSIAAFWDHMAVGIAFGGAWIRYGCIRNGCCVGRESHRWFALMQHDIEGACKRRVPVQWLEIAWWLLAGAGVLAARAAQAPEGSYGLGVLAWYGAGRVWLEPLREQVDVVCGRVRINQAVAALLALVAGAGLVMRLWQTI